jgi:hypothetical protein
MLSRAVRNFGTRQELAGRERRHGAGRAGVWIVANHQPPIGAPTIALSVGVGTQPAQPNLGIVATLALAFPQKALIQTETALNRAAQRNIPLSQALWSVSDGDHDSRGNNLGYYASDTYKNPATPAQTAWYQKYILPHALGGSNERYKTLGFVPTGNASEGNNHFASRRLANGTYAQGK